MKFARYILLAALLSYSAALLCLEFFTSQQFVRNFFTDIEGPVPFYAVNTTLSVFLLWATSLLFAVCLLCSEGQAVLAGQRNFFLSQIVIFAWLGMDDRFKLHESIAWRIGVGDHFVLLSVAVVEVACLIFLGGRYVRQSGATRHLSLAAALFVLMTVIDALLPHDMHLRLSCEDLAKTWGAMFFCLFAWELCGDCIHRLKLESPQELANG